MNENMDIGWTGKGGSREPWEEGQRLEPGQCGCEREECQGCAVGELIGEWENSFKLENLGNWESRREGAAGVVAKITEAAMVISITET